MGTMVARPVAAPHHSHNIRTDGPQAAGPLRVWDDSLLGGTMATRIPSGALVLVALLGAPLSYFDIGGTHVSGTR
jgi:hypothetical protein